MCAVIGEGRIQSPHYCLLPGDLRNVRSIEQLLSQAGLRWDLPTLVLAECVLVYMEPQDSAHLLRSLGSWLPTAACLVYEQIRPDDAFGRQMLMNLEVCAVHLVTVAVLQGTAARPLNTIRSLP